MSSKVRIRVAAPTDLDGIVALDELRSGTAKPAYWARILALYGQGDEASGRVALVAEGAEPTVQGFLFGEVRAWEFGSDPCGWIFSVAVRPEQERHGKATLLCEEAERRFGAMGVDLVRTMVQRNDIPVLSLFRSMGFVAGPFTEMEKALPAASRSREDVA